MGRATRLRGIKTGRQHGFLSDMETNYFYILEYAENVVDIREQFPLLPIEDTILIAEELGIQHPQNPQTGEFIVMTTDFFITVKNNNEFYEIARTIKAKYELINRRILEKFEIERVYWQKRNCYVGFPMMKAGREFENILTQKLIMAGFSIGKVVSMINKILYLNRFELPFNIILGDPDFCFQPDYSYGLKTLEASFEKLNNRYVFSAKIGQVSIIELMIKEQKIIDLLDSKCYCISIKDKDEKKSFFYYFPIKVGKYYHLYICKWGMMSDFDLTICEEEYDIDFLMKERFGTEISNLKMLKYQVRNYKLLESKIVDADNSAFNLMRMIDTMKYNVVENQSGWKKARKLISKLDLINRSISNMLVEEIKKRVYHFPEGIRYMNTFLYAKKSDKKCPLCNDILLKK